MGKLTGTQFIERLARKYPSTESRLLFKDDTIPTWRSPVDIPDKCTFPQILPPKLRGSIRQSRHSLPSVSWSPPPWWWVAAQGPLKAWSCDHSNEWTTTDGPCYVTLSGTDRAVFVTTPLSTLHYRNWIWWPATACLWCGAVWPLATSEVKWSEVKYPNTLEILNLHTKQGSVPSWIKLLRID